GDISSTLTKSEEYRIAYQTQLKTTLETLLEKSVGTGKVKVTVNADIDFDRIVTNSETYDPNGQVARSVQSGEEKEQANEKQGKDNTSAANNLPNAQANSTANGSNRVVSKSDETINYEISKKVENHTKESGKVNKLSVAVLVDGNYAEEKDGKQTYTPKSEEERKQIDTLVKSAIGFDDKRGDKVEIVSMRFIAPVEDIANTSFVEWLKLELHGSIQIVIFGVVVLGVLLIIVPLVNRVIETTMAAAATHEEESVAIPSGAAVVSGGFPGMQRVAANAGGGGGGATAFPGQDFGGEEESSIDLNRITGRVKSSTYNRLNELVDKHPDEALNVIRQWSARRA
ncbi:MAG: flagellar M-ring protein FliF C-terminal domain-containing protein, partial [Pseudomonadota bacterium]